MDAGGRATHGAVAECAGAVKEITGSSSTTDSGDVDSGGIAVVVSLIAASVVTDFPWPFPNQIALRITTPKLFVAGVTCSAYSFTSIPLGKCNW